MNSKNIEKYLNLFEIPKDYTKDDLKNAWKDLLHAWHPDKHNQNERARKKATQKTKEINNGYQYLKDRLNKGYSIPTENIESDSKKEPKNTNQEKDRKKNINNDKKKDNSDDMNIFGKLFAGLAFALLPGLGIAMLVANILIKFEIGFFVMGIFSLGSIFFVWGFIFDLFKEKYGIIILLVVLTYYSGMTYYSYPFISEYFMELKLEETAKKDKREKRKLDEKGKKRKLDEKNGFKNFQFGMTIHEIEKIQAPFNKSEDKDNNIMYFIYNKEKIEDYPLEKVILKFFQNKLYRIDIAFSSNQTGIYNAFEFKYGKPLKNNNWKRGDTPLKGMEWKGTKVICTILAKRVKEKKNYFDKEIPIWDSIILYNKKLYKEAQQYIRDEDIRKAIKAADDL
jgi:curved DNA-binding protein CbpA|tara:strand:- start:822 stop:2006 length:1185 start_codon:yes stop_codon:yes gene_type:complete